MPRFCRWSGRFFRRSGRVAGLLVYFWLLCALPSDGQVAAEAPGAAGLQITPETSQPTVSAGSNFGLYVDLKNTNPTQAIYLARSWLEMCLPPELESTPGLGCWYAAFGALPRDAKQVTPAYADKVVKLEPGQSTVAVWKGQNTPPNETRGEKISLWVRNVGRLLSFEPGDYTIKIAATYWTDPANINTFNDAHSTVLDVKIPVVAPQWVIIVGAILGGLIAYILLPNLRLRPGTVEVSGLFTAALLSTIATILLARISETQFVIKVSINDLWGAIAVGFVATASGTSFLQRYVPQAKELRHKASGGREAKTTTEPAPPQAEAKHQPEPPSAPGEPPEPEEHAASAKVGTTGL
jgi:hypothetical protein